jgi:hypothetical protein
MTTTGYPEPASPIIVPVLGPCSKAAFERPASAITLSIGSSSLPRFQPFTRTLLSRVVDGARNGTLMSLILRPAEFRVNGTFASLSI